MNNTQPTQPTAGAMRAAELLCDHDRATSGHFVRCAQIIDRETGAAELVAALDWMDATAINLHCALQSTACMDASDSRIPVITGQVVRDLLAMRDKARAVLARHANPAK